MHTYTYTDTRICVHPAYTHVHTYTDTCMQHVLVYIYRGIFRIYKRSCQSRSLRVAPNQVFDCSGLYNRQPFGLAVRPIDCLHKEVKLRSVSSFGSPASVGQLIPGRDGPTSPLTSPLRCKFHSAEINHVCDRAAIIPLCLYAGAWSTCHYETNLFGHKMRTPMANIDQFWHVFSLPRCWRSDLASGVHCLRPALKYPPQRRCVVVTLFIKQLKWTGLSWI